jgi:hypothetical protein
MSENTSSQAQQNQSIWKRLVEDQVKRAETVTAEINRLESLGLESARSVVDEAAKISRESFTYFGELSAEWRKITLESTRRAAELFTPRS